MIDYEEHHLVASPVCVFAFASGDTREFEWGGTLKRLGVAYVLLRDSGRQWYARGIPGFGDFHDSVRRIRAMAEPYERTVALGLSTGSYGALLYGAHAGLDEVIAISPVTGKGEDVHPDIPPRFHHLVKHYDGDPLFDDLKPLYRTSPRTWVRAFVSDGRGCDIDYEMAKRIGIRDIFRISGYSHDGLAAHMRDAGIIKELICP